MTDQAQVKVKHVCKLPDSIKESSGLIFENNNSFWTHNDGGNPDFLYHIDTNGSIIKQVKILRKNNDWEEMTVYKDKILIGDFGNNLNSRKNLAIHIIDKKDLENESEIMPKTLFFRYQDQKSFPPASSELFYDCEAMICVNDSVYLFSKNRSKPFDGTIKVYSLPVKSGDYIAKNVSTISTGGKSMYNWWVSGAALVKNDLYLLSTNKIFIVRDFISNIYQTHQASIVNLTGFSQKEALCYDGKNHIYYTDEVFYLTGGNLSKSKISDIEKCLNTKD